MVDSEARGRGYYVAGRKVAVGKIGDGLDDISGLFYLESLYLSDEEGNERPSTVSFSQGTCPGNMAQGQGGLKDILWPIIHVSMANSEIIK